jgi:hypothetical protein
VEIASAWVVPHAPVLVPGLSARRVDGEPTAKIAPGEVETIILCSPHGASTGVYRRASGSLNGFGASGFDRSAVADEELAEKVAASWGRPLLDGPADHGVVVPLWWLDAGIPVLACTFAEVTGPDSTAADLSATRRAAGDLAEALVDGDRRRAVAFVASAHLSAGLDPAAPLAELPGARDFDHAVVAALRNEPRRLLDLPLESWREAGACGLGPLLTLALLCGIDAGGEVHYSAPFGVGYVTGEIRP